MYSVYAQPDGCATFFNSVHSVECRQSPSIYGENCFVHALISVHITWAHKSTYLSIYLYDIYMRTWCFQQRLGSHFTTPVEIARQRKSSLSLSCCLCNEELRRDEKQNTFSKGVPGTNIFQFALEYSDRSTQCDVKCWTFFVVLHSTTSQMVLNLQFCSLVGKLIACEIFLSFFSQNLLRWKMKNNCKVHFSSGPMDIAINSVFIVFHFIWNWLLYFFFGALFPDFNNIDWHFSADALTYLSSISFFHFDNEAINKMVDHYRF